MKRILAVLIMLALPLAAQEEKKADPAQPTRVAQPGVQKLFILKYADVNQVSQLLNVFTGSVRPNPAMHALAVTATAEAMSAIEDAIKRLDVPSSAPQNVEIMAYFLIGFTDSQKASQDVVGSDPPKELESTVAQLKSAFNYRTYKLMEALPIRTRSGQRIDASTAGGAVKVAERPVSIITQFHVDSVSADSDGRIRLNSLRVSQRVPTAASNGNLNTTDIGITTDVDMKEGQKVVVGKNGLSPDEAIFLVLSARVVQ
jgi:hypothetical protein